jgi:hypothetical protein
MRDRLADRRPAMNTGRPGVRNRTARDGKALRRTVAGFGTTVARNPVHDDLPRAQRRDER